MSRPPKNRARPELAFVLALALAALLLLAQGLGLLHRVEHALPAPATVSTGAGGSVVTHAQPADHGLFGNHQSGDADCRLLDQRSHAEALLAAPLPLLAGPPPTLAAMQAPAMAGRRHEARYLARAPPAV